MSTEIQTSHAGSLPRHDELIGDAGRTLSDEQLASAVAASSHASARSGSTSSTTASTATRWAGATTTAPGGATCSQRLGGLELVDVGAARPCRRRAGRRPGRRRARDVRRAPRLEPVRRGLRRPGSSGCALPDRFHGPLAGRAAAPITYTGQEARAARHREHQGRDGRRRASRTASSTRSRRRAARGSATSSTRPTRSCSTPAPTRCARSTPAIVDAGLMLQLDDPAIAESWDQIVPEPSVEAYQRFTMIRIEALNHAIRGLPPERIRFHLCWGSWHGPHVTDIADGRHRRPDARGQRRRLLVRGRQRPPRARVAASGRTSSCPRAR